MCVFITFTIILEREYYGLAFLLSPSVCFAIVLSSLPSCSFHPFLAVSEHAVSTAITSLPRVTAVLVCKSSITWKTRGLNCYTEVSLLGVQQEMFLYHKFCSSP